ncbi:MAG: radical SAM protein [Chitinispirillaceae bacterium]|nr:radical SAM protein [Chitinispirillaceae bacterium]
MKNRILDKIERLGERGYFSNATVECTGRCNLSCRYCYVDRNKKDLSTSELCSAFDKLAEAGVLNVLLTGGELFFREDILEILSHYVTCNFMRTVILSNGTLINKTHIAFLVKHREQFSYVRLSFFSHIPSIHDSFTGMQGSFTLALDAALALKQQGVNVKVIINIIEENVDTLPATKTFFAGKGFDVSEGIVKIVRPDQETAYCRNLTSKPFFDRYFSHFTNEEIQQRCRNTKKISRSMAETLPLCKRLFTSIAIRSDGAIVPCIAFRDHSIGNIRQVDGRVLQKAVRDSELITTLRTLKISEVNICPTCDHLGTCILCPGMMYSENRSFTEPLVLNCNYMKALHEAMDR